MAKSNARAQSEQLFNLQIQGDKYARLLMEQKQRLRQLDAHYRKVHTELKELRLKRGEGDQRGGGVNAVRTRMADEQREMMKLENRLAACKTRESKMVAYNASLRQRVDELRAARVMSQNVFDKNQKKLRDIQKQMQENFRMSTQIMAERDRIITQASSLSTSNMDEQETFDEVYNSLAAIIKRERENAESYRKQILEQDPLDLADDFFRGNMSLDEELQLKKTLHKLDMNLLEDKQTVESINERLLDFDTTFTALQQQMGVKDYHEILPEYTKKEEENFALFRYVQSINNEAEQLEDEKHAIEMEIQKLSNEMKDGSAHARKRMIDDLVETRQKYGVILKENSEYERLRAAALREFQPLTRAVDRLYNTLGCNDVMPPGVGSVGAGGNNSDPGSNRARKQSDDQMAMMARINSMNDLLAAHGITEGNILQFLAIIEQRSSELIEQFSRRLQYKNPTEAARATLGANLRPSDPTRSISAVRAILPEFSGGSPPTSNSGVSNANTTGSTATLLNSILSSAANTNAIIAEEDLQPVSSDEEESDRPLTKAELQKRAAKSVANLQVNPKMQPMRVKQAAAASKKKK